MTSKDIEIIEFTDPFCTWCWGAEPVLKKLKTRLGERLAVRFIMGGLVRDIGDFHDSWNKIGGDPLLSNQGIAAHWLEASRRHGMPVNIEGFCLFDEDARSSYPSNLAYKAAQLVDRKLADRYLRRIREATATEGRQTTREEVLLELASETGLDIASFIGRLKDGSAEAAFKEDLGLVKKYEVRGFPSYLVRAGGKEVLLRGFQTYEGLKGSIDMLSGKEVEVLVPGNSREDVLAFIGEHGSIALVEVKEALDLEGTIAKKMLESLEEEGLVEIRAAGNGILARLKEIVAGCDSESGACSF